MEITDKVIEAVLSAILGGLIAYLTMSVKIRKDLVAKYDLDLRSRRIEVYRKLWKHLQPLAKYSRSQPFTKACASTLSDALRAWYFEVGGIFLSERTRDAYFDLQEKLQEIEYDQDIPDDGNEIPNFRSLRKLGSTLRTAMARDVGTRHKGTFRYEN
jgi:hypothetical protein